LDEPQAAEQLRDRFFAARFAETTMIWQRGIERGQVRPEVGVGVFIKVK
jgi:hypothetical protein